MHISQPSVTFALYLRDQKSNNSQLCFDLSSSKYGQFGKRTVEVANEKNTQWLLGHDAVTNGPCKNMEQILNEREARYVSYCRLDGTVRTGHEYEMQLPRYLERYLNEKGSGYRGDCMMIDIDTSVVLCFDLQDYGKQTIKVAGTSFKWFLRDSAVIRGPCGGSGEISVILDRRETEMESFCKNFGSAEGGYEYEIMAPRFLYDHLREKGAKLGECSDVESGSITANYVPEYFASTAAAAGGGGKLNNKKPKPMQLNNSKFAFGDNGESSNQIKPRKNRPSKRKQRNSQKTSKNIIPNDISNNIISYRSNDKLDVTAEESSKSNNKPNNTSQSSSIAGTSESKPYANVDKPNGDFPEESSETRTSKSCKDCICDDIVNGFIQVPNTNCKEFVQCYDGCIAQQLSCQGSLVFDSNLQVCNWEHATVCGPDTASCSGVIDGNI